MNLETLQSFDVRWDLHDFTKWIRDEVRREKPEEWVRKFVKVLKDGTIEVSTDLTLVSLPIDLIPPHLHVKGNVFLMGTKIQKLHPSMCIDGHLFLSKDQKHLEAEGMKLKMDGQILGDVITI